jgi:hypothetical protein
MVAYDSSNFVSAGALLSAFDSHLDRFLIEPDVCCNGSSGQVAVFADYAVAHIREVRHQGSVHDDTILDLA